VARRLDRPRRRLRRLGVPEELIDALIAQGAKDLTVVNNNAGNGEVGIAALFKAGRIRKLICSYPRQVDSHHFQEAYRSGKVELELVPQGTLSERMRAAGAGIGAFYTPTGYGTDLAKGRETRVIDGKGQVLEYPLHGDVALVKAEPRRPLGQPRLPQSARNYGPTWRARRRSPSRRYTKPSSWGSSIRKSSSPRDLRHARVKVPRKAAAYRAPAGGSVTRGISGKARYELRQTLARPDRAAHRAGHPEGAYVNLGIGMPTLVGNHLPKDREIFLHSENASSAWGPLPRRARKTPT